MIKQVLDEFTAQKVNVLGSDYKTKLPAFVQVDQLEMRFGGIIPDIKDNFFPPEMTMDSEKMMTMAEYMEAV